jgi:acyl-CoA thioesterase-1
VIRSTILVLFFGAAAVSAQGPGGAPVSGLPKVLLVGDSISGGYEKPLRQLLAGKAEIDRISNSGGPTTSGLEHLAEFSAGKWAVVVFNYGLHDMKLDTGAHQVEIAQYEANLKTIADALRKSGAKLVWATTTPVPTGKLSPKRERADPALYNAAAARALQGKVDAVCDLYAAMLPREDELQHKENVHYKVEGYAFLAEQVAAAVKPLLTR